MLASSATPISLFGLRFGVVLRANLVHASSMRLWSSSDSVAAFHTPDIMDGALKGAPPDGCLNELREVAFGARAWRPAPRLTVSSNRIRNCGFQFPCWLPLAVVVKTPRETGCVPENVECGPKEQRRTGLERFSHSGFNNEGIAIYR